jgi:chemotaxis protein CheX
MPATEEISESLLRENIVRAVADVFKTMLGKSVRASEPPDEALRAAVPQVVGTVGFIGDITGVVYLYFEQPFASQCTSRMLGMSDRELQTAGDDVVNDAIGELTNMVAGSFKNALCDAGFPCKLTIPSILRGRNLCVEPVGSAQRYRYPFECAGQPVAADVILKVGD